MHPIPILRRMMCLNISEIPAAEYTIRMENRARKNTTPHMVLSPSNFMFLKILSTYSFITWVLKDCPLCSKFLNKSKLAQVGDKSTTSPLSPNR